MRRWLVLFAIGVSACGGNNNTPTAPTPPPPTPTATLTTEGQGSWVSCLPAVGSFPGACQFQAQFRNTGSGCATSVTGVLTFFNSSGVQVGPASQFGLGARTVRSNELVVYVTTTQTLAVVNQTSTYRAEYSWTNVGC